MIKVFLRTILVLLGLILAFIVISKTLPLPGTIPVLMYRAIGSPDQAREFKHYVSRQSFTAQMAFLKLLGYRIVSIDEYTKIMTGERKPRGREILITFDGGDLSFEKEAWPVLHRYTFPVTLFLVSESLRRESNHTMPVATIKELLNSGLVTLGSNSRTHASLLELNEVQMKREIEGSKNDLENKFNMPVHYFAYPHGNLNAEALAGVQTAGYHLAFTTSYHKLEGLSETPLSLTRLNISRSSDNPIVFWVKVTGLYQVHKRTWYRFRTWCKTLPFFSSQTP